MFNSVFLFVKIGRYISSVSLKYVLLLLIHSYRMMIISLFAMPLTLTTESLLLIAETTLFLFVGVKRAKSNYSCCFKLSIVVSKHSCWRVSSLFDGLHRFLIVNANSLGQSRK